jgi:hypothetical protein
VPTRKSKKIGKCFISCFRKPTQNFVANRLRFDSWRDIRLKTGPREPKRRPAPDRKSKKIEKCFLSCSLTSTQHFMVNRLCLDRLRDIGLKTGPHEPNRRPVPTLKIKRKLQSAFFHVPERARKISRQTDFVLIAYATSSSKRARTSPTDGPSRL